MNLGRDNDDIVCHIALDLRIDSLLAVYAPYQIAQRDDADHLFTLGIHDRSAVNLLLIEEFYRGTKRIVAVEGDHRRTHVVADLSLRKRNYLGNRDKKLLGDLVFAVDLAFNEETVYGRRSDRDLIAYLEGLDAADELYHRMTQVGVTERRKIDLRDINPLAELAVPLNRHIVFSLVIREVEFLVSRGCRSITAFGSRNAVDETEHFECLHLISDRSRIAF